MRSDTFASCSVGHCNLSLSWNVVQRRECSNESTIRETLCAIHMTHCEVHPKRACWVPFTSYSCKTQQWLACVQAPVVGRLYVCLACARMHLCSACFEGGKHPQHSFACCHTPGAAQEPAHRDMQAALLAGLTFRYTKACASRVYSMHWPPSMPVVYTVEH